MPFPPPRKRTDWSVVATVWALQEEPASERLKPSLLLRIASIVSFVYLLGRTTGMPWTPSLGPDTRPIIATG